jgi:hypothetical protein
VGSLMKCKGNWRAKIVAVGFVLALMAVGCALAYAPKTEVASGRMNEHMAVNTYAVVPVGVIIPVTLGQTLSVEHAQAGQEIEGRVKQDVPLTKHDKIAVKSRVVGRIVSVTKVGDGPGVDVSLRFEKIEYRKEMIPIAVSLRAMASYQAVRAAQTPFTGADNGTPAGWANTVQIGGDIRYGDGGEVRSRQKQKVGKGVIGGVLVHVFEQPGSECEGPVNGDDRLQALWVFSSDACGVYGMNGVKIVKTGKKEPVGGITLRFEKADMEISADDAMLLRVVAGK